MIKLVCITLLISFPVFGAITFKGKVTLKGKVTIAPSGNGLLNSLVAYWKMDEASGNRADSIGNNTLTDHSAASTTGKINNALNPSAGTYIDSADNAALSTGNIDFTFACWVSDDSVGGGYHAIVSKRSAGNYEYQLYFDQPTSKISFEFGDAGGYGTVKTVRWGSAASSSTWYFVVAWYDSTGHTINIQINNGTLVSLDVTGFTPTDTTCPFWVGTSSAGDNLTGKIDELGFWKRVLTSNERTQLYNSGSGMSLP